MTDNRLQYWNMTDKRQTKDGQVTDNRQTKEREKALKLTFRRLDKLHESVKQFNKSVTALKIPSERKISLYLYTCMRHPEGGFVWIKPPRGMGRLGM